MGTGVWRGAESEGIAEMDGRMETVTCLGISKWGADQQVYTPEAKADEASSTDRGDWGNPPPVPVHKHVLGLGQPRWCGCAAVERKAKMGKKKDGNSIHRCLLVMPVLAVRENEVRAIRRDEGVRKRKRDEKRRSDHISKVTYGG